MLVDSVASRHQFDYSILGSSKNERAQKVLENPETKALQPVGPASFVLHGASPDASEKLIGAWASNDGISISIFRPADFDPEHPVYRAKVWDATGNITERAIDISKVDPQNADKVEMFAYSSHLSDTGQCSDAQTRFLMASDTVAAKGEDGLALDHKINWQAAVAEFMERQRAAGSRENYLASEEFLSFLS